MRRTANVGLRRRLRWYVFGVAGRLRDLLDLREVLAAQGSALDVRYVRKVLRQLDQALEDVDLAARFEALLRE